MTSLIAQYCYQRTRPTVREENDAFFGKAFFGYWEMSFFGYLQDWETKKTPIPPQVTCVSIAE